MSIEVICTNQNGEETGYHMCSTQGLNALGNWSETLPESDFPVVRELFRDGLIENSKTLAYELSRAIMEQPPEDHELIKILRRFRNQLGPGSESETIHFEM